MCGHDRAGGGGGGGGEVLGLVYQMDTVMVPINPFSAGTVFILQNLTTTCHESLL